MHVYTPMSTCGCQLLGEQRTSCSATQNTDIPSVRLSVPSLCLAPLSARSLARHVCYLCAHTCTYEWMKAGRSIALKREWERERARDGERENWTASDNSRPQSDFRAGFVKSGRISYHIQTIVRRTLDEMTVSLPKRHQLPIFVEMMTMTIGAIGMKIWQIS